MQAYAQVNKTSTKETGVHITVKISNYTIITTIMFFTSIVFSNITVREWIKWSQVHGAHL